MKVKRDMPINNGSLKSPSPWRGCLPAAGRGEAFYE